MSILLKTNTAVRVTVGPFVSITDGYSLSTGMTVTNLAMNMWKEADNGSAPTKVIDAVSFTASGGNNDMVELGNGCYDIELTAAQVNFIGRARLQIYDVDVCLPYWEELLVVPALVFDAIMGNAGGKMGADVVSMATDSLSAAAVAAAAVTKIQNGLAVDSTVAKDATVAKAATALSNLTWTDAKAGYLTGAVALEATLTEIKGAGWSTETLAAIDALIDAIKVKTDNLPASPAAVGSAMTLADDAITAAKFDESTAFPIKSADTGATQIARTGADADTLETLSDEIAGVSGGSGLTAQETRDAMQLAPTAGTPGAGSIDAVLTDLSSRIPASLVDGKIDATAEVTGVEVDEAAIAAAVIASMAGASVTITSPISSTGDVLILRGADYTTELTWAFTYAGDLTGYTAAMNSAGAGIVAKAVTIGGTSGAYTLTATFTNAQTTALLNGKYPYSIKFTKTADSTVLPNVVEGQLTVRPFLGV